MVGTDVPINRFPFHKAFFDVYRGCGVRTRGAERMRQVRSKHFKRAHVDELEAAASTSDASSSDVYATYK